jgi:hypothetical protein
MTELIAQTNNPSSQQKQKDFSTITPGLSTTKFLNYQPIDSKDQTYLANRGGKPHYSIDYGSNAGITLGSKILAVQGGEATPVYSGWGGDAAVQIKSKDPTTGKDVYTTYGHLTQASVKALFQGKDSITVQAGQEIGKVGKSGQVANNEYHVHVDVIDASAVDTKGRSRNGGAHNSKYSQNPQEYFKKVAKEAGISVSTNDNESNTTPVASTSPTALTGSTSPTALTGSISPTALTGGTSTTALTGGTSTTALTGGTSTTALTGGETQQQGNNNNNIGLTA